MVFGTTGRAGWPVLGWLLVSTAALTLQAQEVDDACTLPMSVPDVNSIEFELRGSAQGPGLLVSWPEPDDASSTCYALTGTEALGVPISVVGIYRDNVDRTFSFEFADSGRVGDTEQNRFVCTWFNVNTMQTGRLGGEINLSNTGGLWGRTAAGEWHQINSGLPAYLPYTNLVDLAAHPDGTLVAALSSGSRITNDPVGVFRKIGDNSWGSLGTDIFGSSRKVANIAVDPDSPERFAVGTRTDGVWVTTDGGQNFTQSTRELDPDAPSIPLSFEVTALSWTGSALYVAVANYGLFVKHDGDDQFTRLAALSVQAQPDTLVIVDEWGFETEEIADWAQEPPIGDVVMEIPQVHMIVEDPNDSDRILVGLEKHGIWESPDAGVTWESAWINYERSPERWTQDVLSVLFEPSDGNTVHAGTLARSIWSTVDAGGHWEPAVTPYDDLVVAPSIVDLIEHDGGLLAQAAGVAILESSDSGLTWTVVVDQPFNRDAQHLVSVGGELLLPTTGGGIYSVDTVMPLVDSIQPTDTDADLLGVDLGLSIQFGDGEITLIDADDDGIPDARVFHLVCQDYQGWIVWRSNRDDPDNMMMIGRYDRNNPETCMEGFCGDSYVQLPNCYSERRAACFDLSIPGNVSFYDGDVFNGFTYHYSVTPYDYGDVSLIADPVALAKPYRFPARFEGDPAGMDAGPGNRVSYQINTLEAPDEDGEEIYVFPNPLRRDAGIVGGEGEEVIWTNLPEGTEIQVFTLGGDLITTLPHDDSQQQDGNIYWVTRNDANELLASGVYIWKAIMKHRGDFWGKLVIIR